MNRLVFGTVKRANDTPWGQLLIHFRLCSDGYDEQSIYPVDIITALTNSNGFFEVNLWCNESGLNDTVYHCYYQRTGGFYFTLPAGNDAINLSTLRQSGVNYYAKSDALRILESFIPSTNQKVFVLKNSPKFPQFVVVWLNGVKYDYLTDYNINQNIVTWLSPVVLESTDLFEIAHD
jgi:hypothetical protein